MTDKKTSRKDSISIKLIKAEENTTKKGGMKKL